MMDHMFRRGRLETAIWAAKVLLLCVGTVSTVVFFKAAIIPYLLNLCLSLVPHIWTSFKSCCSLSPLYIYIILNFIILTIAASSTFQRRNHRNNARTADSIDPSHDFIYSPDNSTDKKYNSSQSQMLSAQPQQQEDRLIQSHPDDDATSLFSSSSLDKNLYSSNNEMMSWLDIHTVEEGVMPNTSMRTSTTTFDYDDHRRSGTSTEKCCGDSMPTEEVVEADDDTKTLDTTWKAIMEGQGKPSGKHLKKSDTWDTPPRLTGRQLAITSTNFKVPQRQLNQCNFDDDHDDENDAVTWARRELKKSDTFSDRVSLRREKSMTQDELNQRAEAFIKKFNNDIRLQRLESDRRHFREIASTGI